MASRPVAARSRGLAEVIGWLVLFGAASVLWTWPLAAQLSDVYLCHVPDAPLLAQADANLTTWVLAWGSHALRTAPAQLFDTNAFYPLPKTLAFSEHLLAGVLTVLPLDLLAGPHAVRNHNVLVVASFVVGGAGTALLARELGVGLLPALIGGALFAFHGARFSAVIHIQTLSTHWMPLTLLFLHRFLQSGRWRSGAGVSICLLLALLSSVYWFYYFGIAVLLTIAAHALCTCPGAPRARTKALGFAALAMLATLPVMLQYQRAAELYGLARSPGESWLLSARLITFLGPILQPVDWWLRRFSPLGHPYALGPGALALIGIGLVAGVASRGGDRRQSAVYGIVLLGMALVALGPLMQVSSPFAPGLPGPHILLERLIPGYGALRTPARAVHVAMLPAAVLVAVGADRLLRLVGGRAASRTMAIAFLLAVAGIETWRPPFHTFPASAGGPIPPPAYRWLAAHASSGAVVELPTGTRQDARAMALSTWHWRPLVNGYSGFTPTASWLSDLTFTFPDRRSLRALWEIGTRWMLVRQDEMWPARRTLCEAPLPPAVRPWLERRFSHDGVCIFTFAAEPPPDPAPADRRVSLEGVLVTTSSGDPAPLRDGSLASHWTETVTPHSSGFVQIELPTARPLTRAVLQLGSHFGEFARHLRVEVSDDGVAWRLLADHRALPPPLVALRTSPQALSSTVPLPGMPVRWLRLVRPARDATTAIDLFLNWSRWGIHELELYEASGDSSDENFLGEQAPVGTHLSPHDHPATGAQLAERRRALAAHDHRQRVDVHHALVGVRARHEGLGIEAGHTADKNGGDTGRRLLPVSPGEEAQESCQPRMEQAERDEAEASGRPADGAWLRGARHGPPPSTW